MANERVVAEHFPRTYGVVVMMPAAHLEPGRVEAYASPIPGLFDIGLATGEVGRRCPRARRDPATRRVRRPRGPDVMRWKYTKLLMNVGNAIEAMCAANPLTGSDRATEPDPAIELIGRARAEAVGVLRGRGDRLRVERRGAGAAR